MLKLINIKKDYVTKGVPTVHALKGLTINFRRNEFVAILGASGCGKTTLLNIIGGLDRYSDGDLIIEGKSTKSYTDGDWDTYRNHSVGFVFQSYNLIGHQTILKNVELALTISGISKDERKARATEALRIVGLEGMEKKKPNQLSGGQMQRVAIARSLVNNPEILLADEPTGALDSETSVQIMDLLKEVAKDRLVIMVTHNPDLAFKYATRIVKMSDGLLTDDSNPYKGESKEELEVALKNKEAIIAAKGKKKQTSMSFFTAAGLSFSNLLSKLKRTILIAIAGSIGIIGVSSVLAVSQGVNNYVGHMQDDMLSEYPLGIAEKSVDLSSLMEGLSNWDKKEAVEFNPTTEVGLNSMIEYLMDKYSDLFSTKENDINKELLAYINGIDPKYLASIEYDFTVDPTNNIFTTWNRGYDMPTDRDEIVSLNGLTQLYISELATVPKFGVFSIFMDLFTNFMKPLPHNADFILSQYDVLASSNPDGTMAMGPNDLVLVVDEDQTLTDLVLGQAGYFTQKEFLNIAFKAEKEQELANTKDEAERQKLIEEIKQFEYPEKFTFEELLGKEYYYLPTIYERGVVEEERITYHADLSEIPAMIEMFKNDPSVLDQYKNILFDMQFINNGGENDLIIGTGFGGLPIALIRKAAAYDPAQPWTGLWTGKFSLTINNVEIELEYDIDVKADGTAMIDFYQFGEYGKGQYHPYEYKFISTDAFTYDAFQTDNIKAGTVDYKKMKVSTVLKRKKGLNFGTLERGLYFTSDFRNEYIKQGVQADIITSEDTVYPGLASYVRQQLNKKFEAYVTFRYTCFANSEIFSQDIVKGHAISLNMNLNSSISGMFGFSQTSNLDINRKYLRSVGGVSSRKNQNSVYEISLATPGMSEEEIAQVVNNQMPEKINIYPKDFSAKNKITDHLKDWNNNKNITVVVDGKQKTLTPEMRKELSYTDTVEIIINIINSLIVTVTIALVAFTSLSLIVSCFMIAVITYISTMERVKEIGVIRSLGGRKKDVSRLFIAECLIIGLASGIIGISVTYLFELIFNLSIISFNVGNMADLKWWTALIMIGISITLNVISGFIPSRRASKQDPVVALRTE